MKDHFDKDEEVLRKEYRTARIIALLFHELAHHAVRVL
jgi:hypothetical protein